MITCSALNFDGQCNSTCLVLRSKETNHKTKMCSILFAKELVMWFMFFLVTLLDIACFFLHIVVVNANEPLAKE